MPKNSLFAAAFGVLIVMLLQTGAAHAQATRTWVSGVGDDVNPCSRTAPCKTFAGAISKTAAGGEISVLDSGGFGAVTITKSISIVAAGAEGGIVASLTTGITINGAGIVVNLHGLVIEGTGNGINGIRVLQASRVLIQNCLIRGFQGASSGNGILVAPTTNPVQVIVTDTAISKNLNGVVVTPTGAVVANVHLERVTVEGNSTFGLRSVGTNATILMNHVLVRGNDTGLSVATGGNIASFGTNVIKGNFTANGAPTVTTPLL